MSFQTASTDEPSRCLNGEGCRDRYRTAGENVGPQSSTGDQRVGAVSGGVAYAVAGSQALFVTAGPVTLATGKAAIEMAKKFKA